MTTRMTIFCCGCGIDVNARLTTGRETYPHRRDLYDLPFWRCDACHNFVGCHHQTRERTKPLGVIPTPAIKEARKQIHAVLDPIWKRGHAKRGQLYAQLAKRLNIKEYHTAEIRSVEDAREVFKAVKELEAGYAPA